MTRRHKHLMILWIGSAIFLWLLFREIESRGGTTAGVDGLVLLASLGLKRGIKLLGCYVVFVGLVLAHGVLPTRIDHEAEHPDATDR